MGLTCDGPGGTSGHGTITVTARFPLGTTTVTCSVIDEGTVVTSGSFDVTVQDTTPPTVSVPAPITTNATSADGANVSFSASASDLIDGQLTPECSPESGSTFPIGTFLKKKLGIAPISRCARLVHLREKVADAEARPGLALRCG